MKYDGFIVKLEYNFGTQHQKGSNTVYTCWQMY